MKLRMTEEDRASAEIPYERRLIRRLSLLEAVTIGVGASIGAGIFTVIGLTIWEAGIASILTFSLCGFTAALVGYSYVKLSSIFPESGASYTYVARAFNNPSIVFITGCTLWFAYIIACATYAVGFANYLSYLLNWNLHVLSNSLHVFYGVSDVYLSLLDELYTPPFNKKVMILVLTLLFTGLNIIGVSETGKTQTTMVFGKVLILLLFITVGLMEVLSRPKLGLSGVTPTVLLPQTYTFFIPLLLPFRNSLWGTFTAVSTIFIAFEGFDLIPTAGEELKNPRVIGKAIFITITIVFIIYLFTLITLMGLVPWYLSGASEAPLAEAMNQTWLGEWGGFLLGIGGVLSTASAFNATLFGSSRLMYAMSREGVLPKKLSVLTKRGHIPYISLLLGSSLCLILAMTENLEFVSSMTSVAFMVIFILVSISNLKLKGQTNSKPFIPIAAIAFLSFFLFFVKLYVMVAFFFWLGITALVYLLFRELQARQGKKPS